MHGTLLIWIYFQYVTMWVLVLRHCCIFNIINRVVGKAKETKSYTHQPLILLMPVTKENWLKYGEVRIALGEGKKSNKVYKTHVDVFKMGRGKKWKVRKEGNEALCLVYELCMAQEVKLCRKFSFSFSSNSTVSSCIFLFTSRTYTHKHLHCIITTNLSFILLRCM